MALGCTVRDPLKVLGPQGTALMGHAQALGQQEFQLVTKPIAPMGEVRALVREDVLEKLLSGEVLEIRVVDPALAHRFIGQTVDVFEQSRPSMNRVSIPGRPMSL